ncbi:GFA family protein [Pararoseomonas indoligenes]|uniref:GFA family protein n=1 Tax=Roseomonas indoligenes TaxID=2820811 RepID=A0A940N0C2_9PROT|nr:GFA family protein [Pararoseomonas indoligenes]MBP0491992.1 GFA family protein [Pararoseomonas indoligenes]
MLTGGCHCGAIRYRIMGEVLHHALCHCRDCRRHAGAPMVGWAMLPAEELEVTGEPVVYASSEHGRRHFCGRCGTGILYVNEAMLPGLVDIQTGTLDDPEALPPGAQIQLAERLRWMARLDVLPGFERYPPG